MQKNPIAWQNRVSCNCSMNEEVMQRKQCLEIENTKTLLLGVPRVDATSSHELPVACVIASSYSRATLIVIV